jgi:hypothetical protein
MRIKVAIGRRTLVILINSGSTHNFVDHIVAHAFQLAVTPTQEFTVKVANGEKLRCTERYANVLISIQDFQFSTTLYSLSLHGIYIVLGIQWLENLGPVVCDWKNMTMSFQWENRTIKIVAQPVQPTQEIQIQAMDREVQRGGELFVVIPVAKSTNADPLPQDIQSLLKEFQHLLEEPENIPPS